MRFFKYEGLGNDFIILPQKPTLSTSRIQELCDRHLGIGADGVLFVYPSTVPMSPRPSSRGPDRIPGQARDDKASEVLWNLKVYNQDGSTAKMCGNGIRCVAQFLTDQGHPFSAIQTDSGPKVCLYADGFWSVDMGIAQINGNRVSIGNEHLVLESPVDRNLIDPKVNTEFVDVLDTHHLKVTVFEAGAGETQACGTGACACVAFFAYHHRVPHEEEITVHLKGGNLYIASRQTKEGQQLKMRGPARYVFEGKVFET